MDFEDLKLEIEDRAMLFKEALNSNLSLKQKLKALISLFGKRDYDLGYMDSEDYVMFNETFHEHWEYGVYRKWDVLVFKGLKFNVVDDQDL